MLFLTFISSWCFNWFVVSCTFAKSKASLACAISAICIIVQNMKKQCRRWKFTNLYPQQNGLTRAIQFFHSFCSSLQSRGIKLHPLLPTLCAFSTIQQNMISSVAYGLCQPVWVNENKQKWEERKMTNKSKFSSELKPESKTFERLLPE